MNNYVEKYRIFLSKYEISFFLSYAWVLSMFAQNTESIETNFSNSLFPELFWLDKMLCNIQKQPFVDIFQNRCF